MQRCRDDPVLPWHLQYDKLLDIFGTCMKLVWACLIMFAEFLFHEKRLCICILYANAKLPLKSGSLRCLGLARPLIQSSSLQDVCYVSIIMTWFNDAWWLVVHVTLMSPFPTRHRALTRQVPRNASCGFVGWSRTEIGQFLGSSIYLYDIYMLYIYIYDIDKNLCSVKLYI